MTTRDELYAKFGITAEAAQLFGAELGTLLLALLKRSGLYCQTLFGNLGLLFGILLHKVS